MFIQTKVTDYGKERIIRRQHSVIVGYEELYEKVESTLLEAAGQVEGALKEPESFL